MAPSLTIPGTFADAKYVKHPGEYKLELAHAGQGSWRAFRAVGLDLAEVMAIASSWSAEFAGIERPWLCWNIDDDWCLAQQKLVDSVGWTPVIGFDPRVGPPRKRLPRSHVVDFNKHLGLEILYPHFPLEFAFLFCERVAFWHSDLLVRTSKMAALAARFAALRDGQTAATWVSPGRRHMLGTKQKRYWELVGCTTRLASSDQFQKGCGWWMEYWAHPRQSNGDLVRAKFYWDHGAGIYYWQKREGGDCDVIDGKGLLEGHFTKMASNTFVRTRESGWSDARRFMAQDIKEYCDLRDAWASLDLGEFDSAAQ